MKYNERNFIEETDSYKLGSHFNMYPDNTTYIYSYFEARKGAKYPKTVLWSLQYILKKYFVGKVITQQMIDETEQLMNIHIGKNSFNKEGWQYILNKHDGKLPLLIKAVPEGTAVDVNNVLFTVENTDSNCAWLTNYVESILSHVWYGSTVATLAKSIKDMIMEFLMVTSDNPEECVNFMLHDFGYRGSACVESARIAGSAQLLSFMGTDTPSAIRMLMNYYNANVCAFSVYATEHSIMTARGREGEFDVVRDLLKKYPTGILSVVIDSYDWKNFIKTMGNKEFKEQILKRDGKFVFRPDSGDPVDTTLEILNMLGEEFGYTLNSKGYRVLNPKIGFLWGDGINQDGIYNILDNMKQNGWAASNVVFGMGGALHSKVNRDTQRCAFKSSFQIANGEEKMIFKDPIDSSKKSKKGKLALLCQDGVYRTIEEVNEPIENDLLVPVFKNGKLLIDYTLEDCKNNLNF